MSKTLPWTNEEAEEKFNRLSVSDPVLHLVLTRVRKHFKDEVIALKVTIIILTGTLASESEP